MNEPFKPENIDLDHIARLARLRVDPAQRETLTRELSEIVAFAHALSDVDTDGIVPAVYAAATHNRFREDTVAPSMPRDALLQNAPSAADGCFIVPRVVE